MRSSILLSSALAIGAIATPILDKRYYVTEVDLEIKTVTVYVTPGAPEPTAAAISSYGQRHGHSHKPYSKSKAPAPSSIAAPKPSEVYTPPPAYTPAPTPVQSSKPAPVPSAPAAPIGSHKSGPEQAKFSSGPDYEAMVLYHHNAIRANHGAEPLTWSDECAAAALWSANQCEFKHQWEHPDMNMGQNIFTTSGNAFNVSGGIVESWYKGEMAAMAPYYGVANLNDKPVFHEVGHLTALVWKGTSKVGCASVNCAGKKSDSTIASMNMFTVCNYQDPGNMQDQYANNVQAPISTSNLPQWDD